MWDFIHRNTAQKTEQHRNTANPNVPLSSGYRSVGGGLPNKSDGGARRIFWKWPLKGTRILFCGRGFKLILPLGGTKIEHNLSYS